jgi:NAD(P)-dependent dehydrogenase (short-subunit alcohol dehydrogenase family)
VARRRSGPGEFDGRVALVTGAARGLGADILREASRRGACVAFSYLSSKAAAEALAKELGGPARALPLRADVSREADAKKLVAGALRAFGRVDFLVNNASYSKDALWKAPIEAVPTAEFARVLEVDLVGTFNMCKHAAPLMRKQGFGRIVNFSSAGSLAGDETMLAYNPAKVGVVGLTRTLARALAKDGITVNAIAPGSIDTGWVKRWKLTAKDLAETMAEIPVGRIGAPEDVVHAVLFLLSQKAGFITGQTLRVDGGVTHG